MNFIGKFYLTNSGNNYSKVLLLLSVFFLSSCISKIDLNVIRKGKAHIVSGLVSPLVGLIAENNQTLLMSTATAAGCANPAIASLYKINTNGTITENSPLASQVLKSDARYSFNFSALSISREDSNVQYVVLVNGCNDEVYKRPITDFNDSQDLNARTTVVTEVLNVSTVKKLNEADRGEVQTLLNSLSGTTFGTALDSLTTVQANSDKFTEIFGNNPDIIKEARPRVILNYPGLVINELAVSNFNVSTFHLDPDYSFAYRWKLDGVVKSSAASWNYIPSKNESGTHQIDVYVGKQDNLGNIDLTKPYYTQTFNVDVNNNILPQAPAITINASTPSPRTAASLSIDINTGVSLANCETFSHMAITDSATPPGVMQFTLDCTTSGTQTEVVAVSSTEGNRNVYLWVIDNEGIVSNASTVGFVLDTLAPVPTIGLDNLILKGSTISSVTLSATDAVTGVTSLDLYYSSTGVNPFTLVSSLATNATSYSWSVPADNTTTGKLKLVAVDGAGHTADVLTSNISIDSLPPSAPTLTRTSSASTNVANVTMTVGSCTNTSDILITTTNVQPASSAVGWQTCSTSVGATTYTLTTNGVNTLYAWAKDAVGNVATSANSISVTYDSINPLIVTGPIVAANIPGGTNTNITWSVTDASVVTVTLEYHDGTSWTTIGDNIFNSGLFTLAVPANLNVPVAKIRMTAIDSVGNSSVAESQNFVIDSTDPQITAFTLANSAPKVNTPTVSVQVTATDNAGGSGLYQMRLSEDAAFADDKWQTYSATNGSFSLSMTPGSKTVYIWVKDRTGHVSNRLSTSVTLEFGVPPVLSITGPSITPLYAPAETLHITWSCSSPTGLAVKPISEISYTTDNGANLEVIDTALTNNDTATTGHYDWQLPAALASTPFRIYVKCESASGAQVEKMSDVYQTEGTWRIWAGQMSAKRDGILAYGANKLMIAPCSTGAMDAGGNIYYTTGTGTSNSDSITALMKINAVTGLVERVVGSYTESATSAGEDWTVGTLQDHKIYQKDCISVLPSVVIGSSMDRSEVLFLHNTTVPKIYGINSSNQIRLYATLSSAILTKNFFRQSYFLTKNRQFFYFANNRFYKLDLSVPGQTPTIIYGNGSAALNNTVGEKGTDSPVRLAATGGTNNTACSECSIIANEDGTRLWSGGGYNPSGATGTNTWTELEYVPAENLYRVKSSTHTALRHMYNAQTTDFDDKIYARGRDSSTVINVFDPATATTTTVSVNGFNGLEGGFYFNLFSSISNLYMMGADQEIKVLETNLSAASTIAGNNANKIGDGKSPSNVDFNLITGISLDPASGLLAISQSTNFRFYNFNDTASGFFSSRTGLKNANGYIAEVSIVKDGGRLLHHPSSSMSGSLHTTTIDIPGRAEISTTLPTSSADNPYSAAFDYDVNSGVSDGTNISSLYRYFRNPASGAILSTTGAEYFTVLAHSNGNNYIQAQSKTNNHSYIYVLRASDSKVYKVAGAAGPAGYSVGDHGALAKGALLSASVSFMHEIKTGAYAGDLMIVDGNMIRRVSITTESVSPKIYDIAALTQAADFSVSTVFSDIAYDESTQIGGVLGTGTFYYVRTAPTLAVHKWKADFSNFSSATDTAYELKGLTLDGIYRLTYGSVGVLLLERSQNRVLLLPP